MVSCPPALPLAGPCPLPVGPCVSLSPRGSSRLTGTPCSRCFCSLVRARGNGAVLGLRGVTVPGAPPLHSNKRLGFTL